MVSDRLTLKGLDFIITFLFILFIFIKFIAPSRDFYWMEERSGVHSSMTVKEGVLQLKSFLKRVLRKIGIN